MENNPIPPSSHPSSPSTNSNNETQSPPPPSSPILKSPEEVLADLTQPISSNDITNVKNYNEIENNSTAGGGGSSDDAQGLSQSVSSVMLGGGCGLVAVVGGVVGDVGGAKKRKCTVVKDPPSGTPTCPVCSKTFSSWKGAFGHMRKHPDRDYRGFFRPPTFSSSSKNTLVVPLATPTATHDQVAGEGGTSMQGGKDGEGGPPLPPPRVGGIVFDLNQPVHDEEEDNTGGEMNADDSNGSGFDLNEFPAIEEDDDEDMMP